MSDHTEPNTNGTDYVSDSEFDSLIAELQSITEEARATDYHDTLRKAALFLNLHRAKVIQYANDIVRLDAACTEQHDAYVSACNRVDEINDLDYAKAQVRSAGYSLVSAEFISNFAEFIQDWRKGDFALPKLAALDVEACFDAWQKEVNQNEVKPVLQALERVTWQPIETAPKDGTQVMLTNGISVAHGNWLHAEPFIREIRDLEGRYIDQDESDGYDGWIDFIGGMMPEPTLWMPLPTPPESKG